MKDKSGEQVFMIALIGFRRRSKSVGLMGRWFRVGSRGVWQGKACLDSANSANGANPRIQSDLDVDPRFIKLDTQLFVAGVERFAADMVHPGSQPGVVMIPG